MPRRIAGVSGRERQLRKSLENTIDAITGSKNKSRAARPQCKSADFLNAFPFIQPKLSNSNFFC
jgi:hypothetical protein